MSTDTESGTAGQCIALTSGGERCSRPAGEDGFCYQHDSSNETIDNPGSGGDPDDMTNDDSESQTDEQNDEDDTESGASEAESESEETESEESEETESEESESRNPDDILEIRSQIEATAGDVVGRPLDAIIGINRTDEGWRAVVEVVERKSIPDTQDILGRYELVFDGEPTVREYNRLDRYRRDDTTVDEMMV